VPSRPGDTIKSRRFYRGEIDGGRLYVDERSYRTLEQALAAVTRTTVEGLVGNSTNAKGHWNLVPKFVGGGEKIPVPDVFDLELDKMKKYNLQHRR
jgi:hypothetical protein